MHETQKEPKLKQMTKSKLKQTKSKTNRSSVNVPNAFGQSD